jgi:hypothetical protein
MYPLPDSKHAGLLVVQQLDGAKVVLVEKKMSGLFGHFGMVLVCLPKKSVRNS